MRNDQKIIASLIPKNSKVLDIGCGEGELLEQLMLEKKVIGRGIEISQPKVSVALARGLSVIQGDADFDLKDYPTKAFDYAILGQTLQATKNAKEILSEMLRVANRAIISFPNFGYWYNRFYLGFFGRMPMSKTLSYNWYDTPNIHFCTITDFKKLCADCQIEIEEEIFLDSRRIRIKKFLPQNLFAEQAIFMVK